MYPTATVAAGKTADPSVNRRPIWLLLLITAAMQLYQRVSAPQDMLNNLWIAAAFDRTVTARTTLANLGDYNPNGQEIPSLELIAQSRHPSSQAPRFWIYRNNHPWALWERLGVDKYPEPQMSESRSQSEVPSMDSYMASLRGAISEYESGKSVRSAQAVKLQLAQELIKQEAWDDALRILRPLWHSMTWRREGWWDLTEEVGNILREVASKAGDGGTVVAVDWELMSSTFSRNPRQTLDITKSLDDVDTVKGKPAVVLQGRDIHSFLCATFVFEQAEGKVGEPCTSQLSVTSFAAEGSSPVTMAEINIKFEGSLKPVTIRHSSEAQDVEARPDDTLFTKVALREEHSNSDGTAMSIAKERGVRSGTLVGEESLHFLPGQTRVFELSCPLREPGKAKAVSATFALAAPLFDLECIIEFDHITTRDMWWSQKPARKRVVRADPHSIIILPKPPKMEIKFQALKEQYYTNEPIDLNVDIFNGEDEESLASLEVTIANDGAGNPQLPFKIIIPTAPQSNVEYTLDDETPPSAKLGSISSSDTISAIVVLGPILVQSTYEITLQLKYNLASDLETPITRTAAIRLNIGSPFEANYDFSPRLDSRSWPSFFDPNEGKSSPTDQVAALGLPQKWNLTARYCSFAGEPLIVEDVSLAILSLNGGVACSAIHPLPNTSLGLPILPEALAESHFDVLTQKLSLDDRRSASLDLSLLIQWRRDIPESPSNTSTLPIPRLLVASSEPRVLTKLSYSESTVQPMVLHMEYMIENPSMHFLTFSVVMEPNDKFAFSGAKQSTIQLLPLSRRGMKFNLLPNVRGEWVRPQLVVTDRYFQKVLKVAPGDGMKSDKEGILIWIPTDEE
ncbi:hypothetical protein V490_05858 [Pseudogymnoascus sp. VKM F-3557]|nr:hypothetical protein V490_05858 [Pseudogymnoascus sp. VKM F-3557]